MSKVDDLRVVVARHFSARQRDLGLASLEAFEKAIRDEEFKLHELKEKCRWDGGIECESCPCNKTRYCS